MVRWTVVGSLGAVFVSMGLHAVAQHAPRPRTASVPELSVSGLRTGTAATPRGPVDPSVRIRTSGIPCILSSGVRRLPEHVELRVDGQVRRVPIRNTIEHAGQAVGEVVVPYPLLDGVDYTRTADVKDQIELTGNDVGAVSLTASQIRQSCNITKKDLRKFLDGIFVSWKGPTPEPM